MHILAFPGQMHGIHIIIITYYKHNNNVIPIQGCSWDSARVQPSRQKGGLILQTTQPSLGPC